MLDDAKLLVEFQCKVAEAQAYTRTRIRKGPVIVEDVINKISRKLFKVEYRIFLEEAYTRKVPKVYDYIKTQGYKVIAYVTRASLLGRQDKFMPIGCEGIFIGYNKNTTAYYRVYAPNIHTTVILSNVKFFEDLLGSLIDNYQLQIELLDGSFKRTDSTFNKHVV